MSNKIIIEFACRYRCWNRWIVQKLGRGRGKAKANSFFLKFSASGSFYVTIHFKGFCRCFSILGTAGWSSRLSC